MVSDFAFTLYPFIEARIGGDVGLSEQHWNALGRTVKQIHMSRLPPDLMQIVRREVFAPPGRSLISGLEDAVGGGRVLRDPARREFARAS